MIMLETRRASFICSLASTLVITTNYADLVLCSLSLAKAKHSIVQNFSESRWSSLFRRVLIDQSVIES